MNEYVAALLAPQHRVPVCVERRQRSRGFTHLSPHEYRDRTDPPSGYVPRWTNERGWHQAPYWD